MKTASPLWFCTVVVLCGCTDETARKANEQKIAAVESRLTVLEQQSGDLNNRVMTNTIRIGAVADRIIANAVELDSYQSNIVFLLNWNLDNLSNQDSITLRLGEIENQLPKPKQPATRFPAQTFKNGVPSAIYDAIVSEAQRRFPTDYSTQEYEIRNQVESYKKLHPPNALNLPQ
jgi:hypothetical protein